MSQINFSYIIKYFQHIFILILVSHLHFKCYLVLLVIFYMQVYSVFLTAQNVLLNLIDLIIVTEHQKI